MSKPKETPYLKIPDPNTRPVFPKNSQYRGICDKILDDFLSHKIQTAVVKVPNRYTAKGLVRGLGKCLKRRNLQDKVGARVDTQGTPWLFYKD